MGYVFLVTCFPPASDRLGHSMPLASLWLLRLGKVSIPVFLSLTDFSFLPSSCCPLRDLFRFQFSIGLQLFYLFDSCRDFESSPHGRSSCTVYSDYGVFSGLIHLLRQLQLGSRALLFSRAILTAFFSSLSNFVAYFRLSISHPGSLFVIWSLDRPVFSHLSTFYYNVT